MSDENGIHHIRGLRQVGRAPLLPKRVTAIASEAADYIASQSARIVELEAEVTHWKTHAKMMAKVADNHKAHEKTLEAERDTVRKALHWWFTHDIRNALEHDGTPEGVEAALLAAAREGGAP